ncbi:ABC transporter ATP-binding protein [Pseudochelatococcus lubricantis]|uniref:ABC transporter ATP-binding protein n=1 Tax=Pseudochelatococcus lubricantis TaxID=1538102 RepID=UPI0035EE7271
MSGGSLAGGLLRCENVQVAFGGLKAVNGVSHDFLPGRLYGLIGPNGAGKTTLMNALSGHVTVSAGRVHLDGTDVTDLPVHARARGGLGRSFQITKIFAGMSVLENLELAAFAHRYRVQPFWLPVGRFRGVREAAERVLDEVGLARLAHAPAENLSHGDQRALEVGLTLLGEPRVLLLDEPLAGVGHDQVERAIGLLGRIVKNRTVLLIEHNMDAVMEISDEIIVMVQGQILASGLPKDIRANAAVRRAYLGEEP